MKVQLLSVKGNSMVRCVKLIREVTELGLKDAKIGCVDEHQVFEVLDGEVSSFINQAQSIMEFEIIEEGLELEFFIKPEEVDVSYECDEKDYYSFFILSDENGNELGDGDRSETVKFNFYKKLVANHKMKI